jgi:hypothetical protein
VEVEAEEDDRARYRGRSLSSFLFEKQRARHGQKRQAIKQPSAALHVIEPG